MVNSTAIVDVPGSHTPRTPRKPQIVAEAASSTQAGAVTDAPPPAAPPPGEATTEPAPASPSPPLPPAEPALTVNFHFNEGLHGHTLMMQCFAKLQWPVAFTRTAADLYFVPKNEYLPDALPLLRQKGRVNRVPGIVGLCGKYKNAQMAQLYDRLLPGAAAFMPQTWLLPEMRAAVLDALPSGRRAGGSIIILKPDAGMKGDGITLCTTQHDFDCTPPFRGVAQAYMARPALLDGLKFDFRLYVVLTCVNPLKAFVCRKGLVRFCTEPYAPPTYNGPFSACAHLTNYAINSKSDRFAASREHCELATKRALGVVLRQLGEAYPTSFSAESFWAQVEQIVAASLATLALPLRDSYDRLWGPGAPSTKCFHVLGYDFLMNDTFRLSLLEINNTPSLCLHEVQLLDPAEVPPPMPPGRTWSYLEHMPLCQCMATPHEHVPSPVDLEVKEAVMGGCLCLLRHEMRGGGTPWPTDTPWGPLEDLYTPVDFTTPAFHAADIVALGRRLHTAYQALGEKAPAKGTAKPLTGNAIRRALNVSSACLSAQIDIVLKNLRRCTTVQEFLQQGIHLTLMAADASGSQDPSPAALLDTFDRVLSAFCPAAPTARV